GAAWYQAVSPGSPFALPSRETFQALRAADFSRLLWPALTEAPLMVTVVGDVDEAQATRLVAATFGALPPRRERPRERPDAWFLRVPDHPFATVRVSHEGSAEKAVLRIVWPLYVAERSRRREEFALGILAKVLENEVFHRVRQELGKTYSPSA